MITLDDRERRAAMKYIVYKANPDDGIPIPENEPCFVIRGKDALAAYMVGCYIGVYTRSDPENTRLIRELADLTNEIVEYQRLHPELVRIAD